MNRNLVGSILGRFSIKNAHFVPIRTLSDRDEMSKLYKGPSIDAAYQVSIHLAKRFQIRREDCLEINQSETRIP
jgi:hypothetical protein